MFRNVGSKVAWVGRTASMVFGLALVLALLFGVATMAFGANGDFFKVGRSNVASAVSVLTKSGAGPALSLQVDRGAPLTVNSSTKVSKLNADTLDGKNSSEIGVNGYELVRVQSTFDSTARKSVHARCPEGKLAIGGGAQVFPSTSDSSRNTAPIVLRYSTPNTLDDRDWTVIADEVQAYGFSWWVSATAICATAGTP